MPVNMKATSKIVARLGLEPDGKVQKFFTNTCRKHMDKYVPMDEGNLRTIIDEQPSWITYEMPYARYQYYGVRSDGTHQVVNYSTPNTGPYWDKRMVSAEMRDVEKEVQDYVRRK